MLDMAPFTTYGVATLPLAAEATPLRFTVGLST
jgi:hypothetical protein